MINLIICEHPLPIPRDKLEEEDVSDFDSIQWDEREFQTISVIDIDVILFPSKYTISEDGQLYKQAGNSVTVPLIKIIAVNIKNSLEL